MKKQSPFRRLWGGPIVMGALTTTGLLTALVSDTWGDWWSWVGLGVPVAVMGWYSWARSPVPAASATHATDSAGAASAPSAPR